MHPWNIDLRILADVLQQLDENTPPDVRRQIEAAVSDITTTRSPLNEQEIVVALMQLVKRFGHGHVALSWEHVGYGLEKTFPIQFTWFDDGLYVTQATPDYAYLLDTRLVRVGQVNLQGALSAIASVAPTHPSATLYASASTYLSNPGILYGLGVLPEPSGGRFTFEDAVGHMLSVDLTPLSPGQATWASASQTAFPAPLPRAANYWFTYVRHSQSLYFQYNCCASVQGLPFEAFVADLMNAWQNQPVTTFVVDLRGNPAPFQCSETGNSAALNELLLAGIAQRFADERGTQLFVLVGPGTSGAAAQLTAQLRQYTPAVLVSAPYVLAYNDYAKERHVRLPHSGLNVHYAPTSSPAALALEPDLVLLPQAQAYRANQEPMLAAITALSTTTYLRQEPPQPYIAPRVTLTTNLRSDRWREDLYALVKELQKLPKIHDDKFELVSSDTFTQAVDALNAAIPSLEDHKVVVGMMQLLTMLGDAHTRIPYWTWEAFERSTYPIQVEWFSDGLFVTAAQPGYEALLGQEIIQIGETESARALDALARVVPHENAYGLRAHSPTYLIRPVILHALGLVPDLASARFVFQDADGQQSVRQLPAQESVQESAQESAQEPVQESPDAPDTWIPALDPDQAPLYLQRPPDIYYWYTYLESSRTLYFQYNVCGEMEELPFEGFTAEMFAFIRVHGVRRLIIDLRRNDGGRIESLAPLLINLQQYPELSQEGRIFVLTSGQTFSSAVYLASLLRQQTNATLIGEPTAQGPNFYASPASFTLPNSALEVQYPLVHWESSEDQTPTIEPDIWVERSSHSYFAGDDPVLKAALAQ